MPGAARKPPDGGPSLASIVQRLGVLLAAGVAPASAWGYLADSSPRVLAVVAELRGGDPIAAAETGGSAAGRAPGAGGVAEAARGSHGVGGVAEAVLAVAGRAPLPEREAWRGLAAAWLVAREAGAPLASTLASFAGALRDLDQTRREHESALAGPRATARLVLALPVVAVLFGLGLGFDPLGVLFGTPAGAGCLGAGLGLMWAARAWNRRLLRAAQPAHSTPGLRLDLLAVAVSGGGSLTRARTIVDETWRTCGLDGGVSASAASGAGITDAEAVAAESVFELSRRAGVPAAALLRAEAEEARREARAAGERAAATLGVTLMLPLGLCILPAFILLGVAPLLISLLSSTLLLA